MANAPYFILPGVNGFKGALLDQYLEAGYYRMLHTLFTTNHTRLDMEGDDLPVFWLRTQVRNIEESSTALAVRKKSTAFSVTCKEASITDEIEALYDLYYNAVDFNTAVSCNDCLHDSRLEDPFDSRMIEIRDAGMLVAVGYFDLGQQSISGILNFYHPGYKKYSLGKYLILKKIDYALEHGIPLYYTGYICAGSTRFDYKLFPSKNAIELYLPVEGNWVPYRLVNKEWLQDYCKKHFI